MKKSILFLLVFASLLLVSCTSNPKSGKQDIEKPTETNVDNTTQAKKLSIVTTTFPQYDWIKNILGDRINEVDLTLLQKNGVDLHSYEPSVEDIAKISNCNIFVYVGGISDSWVTKTLENKTNQNMIVINLMDILGSDVKEEELVEGMTVDDHNKEENHETELDEHIWLSIKNARKLTGYISSELEMFDPTNATMYKSNFESYDKKLADLDNEYLATVQKAKNKTIIFADRFPFRYLLDDYGLDYYAAFSGCSSETEASFENIVFLSKKVDEYKLKDIFVIDGSNQSIAKTIKDNTANKNQEILTLDSMQSVTDKNIKDGVSYISIMKKNLDVLKKVL